MKMPLGLTVKLLWLFSLIFYIKFILSFILPGDFTVITFILGVITRFDKLWVGWGTLL